MVYMKHVGAVNGRQGSHAEITAGETRVSISRVSG